MWREMKGDILYCYRDDKKRLCEEIGGCLLAIIGGILLVYVATGIWG